ncbi:MAG: tyrosine--tRNA ligase [Candidatus Nanoarchaeia archaeon]
MDVEEKIKLVKAPPTEEILTEGDLRTAFELDIPLNHYIGFEISGLLHLGTGLITTLKIADLQKAGIKCNIFLADYHAWINEKLGGDLDYIKKTAVNFYKDAFKLSLEVAGADPDKIKFIIGSELYENLGNKYWTTALEIAKHTNLARIKRSITIAGRKLGEAVNFALLWYPVMQVADIFALGANLAHGGMDQRKAHVVARDVAMKLKYSMPLKRMHNSCEEQYKPIAMHTHLILGMQEPPIWPIPKNKLKETILAMKMSKSKPNTAVYLTDSEENIRSKLMAAFCPAKHIEYNPILDWTKHIIFKLNKELTIEREKKYGGEIHFNNYVELEKMFAEGRIHPIDLKNAVANALIDILKPIREHFENPKYHEMMHELEQRTIGIKKPQI